MKVQTAFRAGKKYEYSSWMKRVKVPVYGGRYQGWSLKPIFIDSIGSKSTGKNNS